MFEWCSRPVISTSSPWPTRFLPYVCATRLIASVVPRTNTISRVSAAFRKRRTLPRAFS